MSPYWIVFSKAWHLPAIKKCNMAYDQASKERKLQLQELEELRLEAYKNSQIYKRKDPEKRVPSRLEASKLRSRWDEPFVITNVFLYGVVELRDEANNRIFMVETRVPNHPSRDQRHPTQLKSSRTNEVTQAN
ncbi:hypothetical protein CR513_48946, partial [Mucuna pruriens]